MKRARISGGIEVYDEDEGGGLRRHVINSIVKRSCELPKSQRLTTGCPLLDATLQGGLRTGHLHEIVGESNCGKTQLCLQLLLTCQWNPSHGMKKRIIEFENSKQLITTIFCFYFLFFNFSLLCLSRWLELQELVYQHRGERESYDDAAERAREFPAIKRIPRLGGHG